MTATTQRSVLGEVEFDADMDEEALRASMYWRGWAKRSLFYPRLDEVQSDTPPVFVLRLSRTLYGYGSQLTLTFRRLA